MKRACERVYTDQQRSGEDFGRGRGEQRREMRLVVRGEERDLGSRRATWWHLGERGGAHDVQDGSVERGEESGWGHFLVVEGEDGEDVLRAGCGVCVG